MVTIKKIFLVVLCLSALGMGNPEKETSQEPDPKPKQFVVKGSINLGKITLKYTTRAAETIIRDKKGNPTASIFSIAYFKDGVEDFLDRPISFVFNGGPGSSSVWLHFGLLGPMRVIVPSDGSDAGASPYRIEQNPFTLLSVSDLVFIDPVGTGYSRSLGKSKEKDYWNPDKDTESIAEFMRLIITKFKRWNSPKFIIGESYGSIRAALLVGELQQIFTGLHLNGVILVSPALDVKTFIFSPGNELPFITYIPSYAAAAWYHDRLPKKSGNLETFLQEVRDFAINEYLIALFKGDSLEEKKKSHIIDKLHQYTGLGKNYIKRSNLRIYPYRFVKELLRDHGLVLGLHDSRCTGNDTYDAGEFDNISPDILGVDGAYTAAINDYLSQILKVDIEQEYDILNLSAAQQWERPKTHKRFLSGFVNVMPILAKGARDNKDLKIFVANGYYDLTTTFFSAEYMFNHSGIPKERIFMKHYHGGHMMYTHEPTCKELAGDLKAFIQKRNQ